MIDSINEAINILKEYNAIELIHNLEKPFVRLDICKYK